jgi:hypothetical protein
MEVARRTCFILRGASYNSGRMAFVKDFRRMALALDGAFESAHMGHPDFRAHGRIFATIQHDSQWGGLMLTPEQQQRFLRGYRDAFKPAAGAWGASGSTLVHFASVDEDTLGEALSLCWQNAAAKAAAKTPRTRTSGTRTSGTSGTRGTSGTTRRKKR